MLKRIITMGAVLLFAMVPLFHLASGEGTEIEHTDPTGDYSNDGMDETRRNNIDITSVSVDFSGDPIIMELTVAGTIDYTDQDYNYIYTISLDHDGDADEETEVEITKYGMFFTSDYGIETSMLSDEVSGAGTSTLRVELPASHIAGHPGILDVMGEAEVDDVWNYADDIVNEDFGGGGGPGPDDDDDDTEPTLYLPEDEDPAGATPTDTSLNIKIDDFDFSFVFDDDTYTLTQEASGDGDGEIYKCAYTLVHYPEGGGSVWVDWSVGPMEESFSFGGMSFEERFRGTGAGNTWDSWEWYLMSAGPSDTQEIQDFKDGDNYFTGLDRIVLYVRAFDIDGEWNQASRDITQAFRDAMGAADDDSTDDDDASGDDDDDDDSPGFELGLVCAALISILGSAYLLGRRRH
ncbi:MAG: hypothetical protein ACMUHY_04475 [Thermoplasmatota archaeon]